MTTRREVAHEARRRAAREGRTGSTVPPPLVINCGRCDGGQGGAKFVERFRFSVLADRWEATAQTPEVQLTADDRPTADPLGWDGFRDRLQYDSAMALWLASARTPEGHLSATGLPADTYGWDKDRGVRSVWVLRCPRCGNRCPARDGNLQAVAWRLVHRYSADGRSPRKLPSLTLDGLRRELAAVPDALG